MMIKSHNERRLIFDGNSLSQRANDTEVYGHRYSKTLYSSLIAAGKKCSFWNFAIGGRTTTQLIAEFSTKVQPTIQANDVVIMFEYINDSSAVSTGALLYANLVTYGALVQATGAKFIVCTCPVFNASDGGVRWGKVQVANALLVADHSFADGFVDLAGKPEFDTITDYSNATYYYSDEVHLTNAGYDLLASYIFPTVNSFF